LTSWAGPEPAAVVVTVLSAAVAAALMCPVSRSLRHPQAPSAGWVTGSAVTRSRRVGWALAAGIAGVGCLPGPAGWVAGGFLAVVVWTRIGRLESRVARRARAAAAADLPHLVSLLAAVVRAGASPEAAVLTVCAALPGPASERLVEARSRLALGTSPVRIWSAISKDAVLGPLGRCLARAHDTGAPVADEIQRLAEELARRARTSAEDRARTVGVRAALPLGVCLLPSFLLLGIVPVIGSLMSTVLR
jgi:Flp pilus assembly protein TadB